MLIKRDSDLCNLPTTNGKHSFGTAKFSRSRASRPRPLGNKVFLRDVTIKLWKKFVPTLFLTKKKKNVKVNRYKVKR